MKENHSECTFTPILSASQLPKDDEGWNYLPFLPIQAQLKHYFYPMAARMDFNGNKKVTLEDIENMQLMTNWIRTKNGQPATIQFLVNQCKEKRTDAGLIYYNSGVFLKLPEDSDFEDLEDSEYHVLGNEWWKLWSNIVWEKPRNLNDQFIHFSEPNPIRSSIKRNTTKRTMAEEEFLNSCYIPENWANNNVQMCCSQVNSEDTKDAEAKKKWNRIQMEQKNLATVPIHDPFFNWKFTGPPPLKERIQFIMKEIQKLNFQTIHRISHHSKVVAYEAKMKKMALESLQTLIDMQEEKAFYDLNAAENENIINDCYLPNLHTAMIVEPRKGLQVKVYEDQGSQCDEEINTSYKDWSGQWSPMESENE